MQAAFVIPVELLGRRRVVITLRTAKPFRPNFDDHRPTQDWQMAQTQLSAIAVELADFVTTSGADGPFARAFDGDHDLVFINFGFQDADFRQIQGNFDIRWYFFTPQFGMVEGENVPWFIPISKTTRYRGAHASSQRAQNL